MKKEFKYRDKSYFNEDDTYVFKGLVDFKSKVEFSNGHWWTVESLQYKATTVECYKIEDENNK